MEIKNTIFATADEKYIRMDINHPKHGWIPYAACKDGPDQMSKDLYMEAIKQGGVRAYDQDVLREEELRRPG